MCIEKSILIKNKASNIIEIASEHFFHIIEKLNYQCKVDIIFLKSFCLNW